MQTVHLEWSKVWNPHISFKILGGSCPPHRRVRNGEMWRRSPFGIPSSYQRTAQSLSTKWGNWLYFKISRLSRVSVPGAFKLDHMQPFKPILFRTFSNFFTFILGSQFLLPQRANNGKGKFSQLPIWMRLRGFSAWGIQTGPFAAL